MLCSVLRAATVSCRGKLGGLGTCRQCAFPIAVPNSKTRLETKPNAPRRTDFTRRAKAKQKKTRDENSGRKNLRFPRVTHIRKDKGPEGCIDTNELAALRARPRIADAARAHRNNRTPGGHGGSGSRRMGGGGGDAGERKRARGGGRGGRQVSELYALAEGAVAVKWEIFVAASDSKKPLEMCVMGDRFDGVSTRGKRQTWRGGTAVGLGRVYFACGCH